MKKRRETFGLSGEKKPDITFESKTKEDLFHAAWGLCRNEVISKGLPNNVQESFV